MRLFKSCFLKWNLCLLAFEARDELQLFSSQLLRLALNLSYSLYCFWAEGWTWAPCTVFEAKDDLWLSSVHLLRQEINKMYSEIFWCSYSYYIVMPYYVVCHRKAWVIGVPVPCQSHILQCGSNMTGTDLYVNNPHCAAAVRPWESEATTSTLPPARVRTCSVLSGSC